MTLTHPDAVAGWLAEIVERDAGNLEDIALAGSSAWSWREGAIRHGTNRFFNVVGLAWQEDARPFIEQREIGTLGLIARPGGEAGGGTRGKAGLDFLMHAKAEPGNVGLVQLAPSCQATASNADRVHGGTATPFSSPFSGPLAGGGGTFLSDSLQSEQGSRFLAKRNRNAVLLAPAIGEPGPLHRWVPFDTLRELLAQDFLVNTDTRSVLCTSDWPSLAGRIPFPGEDGFSRELRASFQAPVRRGMWDRVTAALDAARAAGPEVRSVALDAMPGWGFDPGRHRMLEKDGLAVRQIRVRSRTREVTGWDQPIFDQAEPQAIDLPCGRADGLLLFGYRPRWEPGLLAGAELAPGLEGQEGRVRLEVRQSDEGGRFYRDIASYRVLDLDVAEQEPGMLWLTLAEVHAMMPRAVFNNEARSATSLLLSLA
jgi:oxidase EvaA